MFNLVKFEFVEGALNYKLIIEEVETGKSATKIFLDINNESKKTVLCKVATDSTVQDLLKIGENLSKELTEDFEVEITGELTIDLKHVIENLLVGLTPTNYYSREYEIPKVYKVKASYEFQAAYIDGYNQAFSYNVARVLNHLPYADCNPDTMITFVEKLFIGPEVNITVMRKKECMDLKMNGILALSQASRFEPTIIKIEYKSDQSLPNVGLVGKGVMFDTGGYSIKVGRDITNMKADMGGVAAVLGALHYLSSTDTPANVTGYLMITDNMINNEAIIPGDVITYSNDLSVEIGNTDAEGRLILADGILLAKRDGAERIIDIATLTGNAEAALGSEYAAMFSNKEELATEMLQVNSLSNDKVWHMPLVKEYKQSLKGNIADLRNISSLSFGGSITAALFLESFAEDTDWIHVDMASGTERSEFGTKYSGYGVRLLSNYIKLVK